MPEAKVSPKDSWQKSLSFEIQVQYLHESTNLSEPLFSESVDKHPLRWHLRKRTIRALVAHSFEDLKSGFRNYCNSAVNPYYRIVSNNTCESLRKPAIAFFLAAHVEKETKAL